MNDKKDETFPVVEKSVEDTSPLYKDYKTQDDLLAEILAEDPDFKPINIENIGTPYQNSINERADSAVILEFNDLKKLKVEKIEYVIYPILPTEGLGFIYAATGVGKTLFALNVAYAIAAGGSFLKYKCPLPRKVLYVDGEMQFNLIHERVMQINSHQGDLYYQENLNIFTPNKNIIFGIPRIDIEDDQKVYEMIIDKRKIEVVIFDNLSVLSSIDENKANEWQIIQKWLLHLRAIGKTVIIVHHAGKDKNGYRGTSKMLDCVDFAISLQPISTDEELETSPSIKKFKLVYQKNRIFYGEHANSFEIRIENDEWRYQSNELTRMEKIIDCYKANMTQRDIAREMNLSQSMIFKMIKKAKLKNLIT